MMYIRLLFSVLTLVVLFSYFIYLYFLKRKIGSNKVAQNLLHKRDGIVCYSCNNIIITDINQAIDKIVDDKEDLSLCKSCQRDVKLSNLLHNSNLLLIFKKWVLSKKSEKIMVVGLCITVFMMLISFLLLPRLMNVFSMINNIYLTIYWLIMIYRVYLNRK